MKRLALLCMLWIAAAHGAVTVWLIPAENAGPGEMAPGELIRDRVNAFNERFAGTRVTIENTTDVVLKMQLLSWNPAFVVPNASVVISQERTLKVLVEYATTHDVDIRVRFITWDEAFGLISRLNSDDRSIQRPDVVQIGSTWGGYLAARSLIMSRPNHQRDRGQWQDLPGLPASALPYITDVRLLFYWKRLPAASPDSPEFVLNTSSWDALVESVRDRAGDSDTITFPTGLTLNVLHDYAPLVWAGGGTFFGPGWLGIGNRVDLTSKHALGVPMLLQRTAVIQSKPGQPRRLITFPESSHEEVDRIFVNGGYRVTQEPANFIDRWRQDFRQRHGTDGRNFWDYAAAAVPPVSFRGGSELVVTRGASDPAAAFAVADFLAGDPGYTKILAESGFLPSGRLGGTEILRASMADGGTPSPETLKFVDSVQKAIQQGRQYPDFSEWPTALESASVQEAMQLVWRRIAEGDPKALERAAHDAERLINSQIHWADQFRNSLVEARWGIALTLLIAGIFAGYFVYRRWQTQRNLMLLLFFYRAFRHEAAKFLGDNFHGLAITATQEQWPVDKVISRVFEVAHHFSGILAPHIDRMAESQFDEMRGKRATMALSEIANLAYDGANAIYVAKYMRPAPEVYYDKGNLDGFLLKRIPVALIVALEEWFLNSIKNADMDTPGPIVIALKFEARTLVVESSGELSEERIATLRSKPNPHDMETTRQGLKLIRNILFYAYGIRARAENIETAKGNRRIRLSIRLGRLVRKS